MSALAHYFETAGIPTTLLALVREHAEAMHPPRALAVPFELGRPLGAPEDAAFQRRVIAAALALMERPSGPILEGYPEDAPADGAASEADESWACPVTFAQPKVDALKTFAARLQAEVAQMKPWHETWKRRKGFSGVGAAGAEVEVLADYLGQFADGADISPPFAAAQPADGMKLAINDLMTFYQEAANAQPGTAGGIQQISDWFWTETVAGEVLLAARKVSKTGDDKRVAFVLDRLALPHSAAAHDR